MSFSRTRRYLMIFNGLVTNPVAVSLGITISQNLSQIVAFSLVKVFRPFEFIAGVKPVESDFETRPLYTKALKDWFNLAMQSAISQEQTLYPDKSHSVFRGMLTGVPLLANLVGQVGTPTVDYLLSQGYPPAFRGEQVRQRTFTEVPIAFVLYISMFALAHCAQARQLMSMFFEGLEVPHILVEVLKVARTSQSGKLFISPRVEFLSQLDLALLGLKNSIFDVSYISSDQGLQALQALFVQLKQHPSNYIQFEVFKNIQLNSGFQTTATAIITSCGLAGNNIFSNTSWNVGDTSVSTADNVVFNTLGVPTFKLISQHSYGTAPNIVHIMDSILFGRTLLDGSGGLINIGSDAPEAQVTFSTSSICIYMVQRGSGVTRNSLPAAVVAQNNGTTEPPSEETPVASPGGGNPGGSRGRGNRNKVPGGRKSVVPNATHSASFSTYERKVLKTCTGIFKAGFISRKSYFRLINDLF